MAGDLWGLCIYILTGVIVFVLPAIGDGVEATLAKSCFSLLVFCDLRRPDVYYYYVVVGCFKICPKSCNLGFTRYYRCGGQEKANGGGSEWLTANKE